MVKTLYESEIEQIALDVLRDDNGYTILHGPELLDGRAKARDPGDVFLADRLRAAIDRLNPHVPAAARAEALRRVLRSDALTLLDNSLLNNNEAFHRLLVTASTSNLALARANPKRRRCG